MLIENGFSPHGTMRQRRRGRQDDFGLPYSNWHPTEAEICRSLTQSPLGAAFKARDFSYDERSDRAR
jgi:hypothetical protein